MQFSILGPLRVAKDETPLDLGGNKQRVLLAALVLARSNVVATDRLIEVIWGDNPPSKPYVAIRSYISHLRKQLEPEGKAGNRRGVLVTQSPGYALRIEPDAVDAFRFEAAVAEVTELLAAGDNDRGLTVIDDALDLWNSTDLRDSPLSLFLGEAERLLELRRQAVALRFDAKLALGTHEAIIADLRSLVDADPTQERHLAQLMLALYRSGRPAEAVQVYQIGLKATIEASGLEPSSALADLERRILQNDQTLDWSDGTAADSDAGPTETFPQPIGRAKDLARLAEVLEHPAGQIAVISGEPGIGKSELMRYAARTGEHLGHRVTWGFGHRDSRSIPLAPWRAIIGDLADSVEDEALLRLVNGRGAELAMLAPTIATRLDLTAEESRDVANLKDAIAGFLKRAAADRPLLVCMDDLHWMDDSSLAVLSYLVPSFVDQPLVFVATWRDTENLDEEHALALAEIGRLAEGRRFELFGLDTEAVCQLWVEAATGADRPVGKASSTGRHSEAKVEVDKTRMAELQRRTAGNPLFVKELVRSSADPDKLKPNATINDVISARLASLPEGARQILNIGSLCPGGFDERLLTQLSVLPGDDLVTSLELLISARLIEEDQTKSDRFNFTHSLIAESLAGQMSGVRKARLHTQIAAVLEQEKATIDQLAHHLLRGAASGDPVMAATYALAAANEASRLHDHASAIDLIERGLAALDRSDDDQLRAKLMIDLNQERKHKEHYTQAHAAAQEGFRLAKRAGDVELMVAAALAFCGQGKDDDRFGISWLGYWNPPGPALDMLGQCLEKLPAGPQRVVVLIAYASQLFGEFNNPSEAAIILDEAIAEARISPHQELLAAALNQQIFTLQRHLSYKRRKANIEESILLANEMASPERIVAANRALTILRLDENDVEGARDTVTVCEEALRGRDEPALSLFAESMTIALDLYQGKLTEAETGILAAMARYERIGSAALDILGIQYATLLREQGKLDEVENMMRWKVSGYPGPAYGVALAMVMAEQGKHDAARSALADYGGDNIEAGGEGVLQYMTPSFYADTIMCLGDVDMATRLYPAMAKAARRTVAMYSGIVIFGSGSLYLGRLATLLGQYEEAQAHLADAGQQHRAVGSGPYSLRTMLATIDLQTVAGTVTGSPNEELTVKATDLADQLGMRWLTDMRLG